LANKLLLTDIATSYASTFQLNNNFTAIEVLALPTTDLVAGDYAQTDGGAGNDVINWAWDVDDAQWVKQLGQSNIIPIVNDTTTGGAASALSAEQGVNLGGGLSHLMGFSDAQDVRDNADSIKYKTLRVRSVDGGVFKHVPSSIYSDLGANKPCGWFISDGSPTGGWERTDKTEANVLHFGFKGDGITNDTESYRGAMFALEAQEGGICRVPFIFVNSQLTGTVDVPNKVSIIGSGFRYNSVIGEHSIVYTGAGVGFRGKEAHADTDRSRNINISNLRVDVSGAGGTGIQLKAASSCSVRDCYSYIEGVGGTFLHWMGEPDGKTEKGCFYNDTRMVRGKGTNFANGQTLVKCTGELVAGHINDNYFGVIFGANLDTVLLLDEAKGNELGIVSGEAVNHIVKTTGESVSNRGGPIYGEGIHTSAISTSIDGEFNAFTAGIISIGGGGGVKYDLLGKRDSVDHDARRSISGTYVEARHGDNESDLIQWADKDFVTGSYANYKGILGGQFMNNQSPNIDVDATGYAMNPAEFQIFRLNFIANVNANALSIGGGENGQEITLLLRQNVAGDLNIRQSDFISVFKFIGNAYELTKSPNALDILRFKRIAGSWYQMCPAAQDLQ